MLFRVHLVSILSLTLLVSCSSEEKPERETDPSRALVVATTLPVLGAILEEILLPEDQVIVLLEQLESPHDYQPKASDIRKFRTADIALLADPTIDGWAAEVIPAPAQYLSGYLSDGLLETKGNRNAHFWMSPATVGQLLPPFLTELCQLRADSCLSYTQKVSVFQEKLVALSSAIVVLVVLLVIAFVLAFVVLVAVLIIVVLRIVVTLVVV